MIYSKFCIDAFFSDTTCYVLSEKNHLLQNYHEKRVDKYSLFDMTW